MKRLVVGVLVFCLAAPASAGTNLTERTVKFTIREYLGAMLEAPGQHARSRVFHCQRQHCRFTVQGTARCRGVAHVRSDADSVWVWLDPLRCR